MVLPFHAVADVGKQAPRPVTELACTVVSPTNQFPADRREQLFNELEERQLTEQEEHIISRRLKLQRHMFAAYEAREQERQASGHC